MRSVIAAAALAAAGPAGALEAVVSAQRAAKVPAEPGDPAWASVASRDVPLTGQRWVSPGGGGATPSVSVKALYDGEAVALRLEWPDARRDDDPSAAERFADACAVQFPAQAGSWPSPFMGDAANPVVIWRWSAAAQADLGGFRGREAARPALSYDEWPRHAAVSELRGGERAGNPLSARARRSAVEVLAAKGYGTLTHQGDGPAAGRGAWKDGRWSAVIRGPFRLGAALPVAFAVWDGASGERDGMKSVSVWHTLALGAAPAPAADAPARGERVFARYGCAQCHGQGGKGGVANWNQQGGAVPPLDKVAEGFTPEEVKKVVLEGRRSALEDPRGPNPPLHMVAWKGLMDGAELDDLVAYLFSLAPKGAEW